MANAPLNAIDQPPRDGRRGPRPRCALSHQLGQYHTQYRIERQGARSSVAIVYSAFEVGRHTFTRWADLPAPGSLADARTMSQKKASSIPLRRPLSRQSSGSSHSSDAAHRWKQKHEESEERRKSLLGDKERALRSLHELERRHAQLQERHEQLETELFEKNEEFARLSTASKNLYKEYETLKNQYETETGAMCRALKDATHWYKENKQLRRQTLLLQSDAVDEGVDAGDSASDADIENLNKTIKQLSAEVAELQTELDGVRQSEFQTLELNAKLAEELDAAKLANSKLEAGLVELRADHTQLLRVSELMRKELEELREVRNSQRHDIMELRKEAGEQKKERNILAHQSNLLLQGLSEENGTDSLMLLQEIESLKRTMEEERTKYEEELASLQERLEDQEDNAQLEILEERLKLVEAELQAALAREQQLKAPKPPPPPPPPPPAVPLRRRKSRATPEDLARSVGATPEKKAPAPGVNEDIINAIKEGKFTLRKRKKEGATAAAPSSDAPKAVSELLNILGSLRRAPKKRQSQLIGDPAT